MLVKPCLKVGLLVLLAAASACDRQGRQQMRDAQADLSAMQQAAAAQQEVPPPSEDAGRYGKAEPLIQYMFERYAKVQGLDQEFLALFKEAELWVVPSQWKDPKQVKAIRAKAERLVALVDQYQDVMDETTGEKGLAKVISFDPGKHFMEAHRRSLLASSEQTIALNALLEATRGWAQSVAELIALVDEKLAKVDGRIPKFRNSEDAERYRKLDFQIQQEHPGLLELSRRYLRASEDYRKLRGGRG